MQRNRKADNELFTLFDDGTLHLYDNLVEVEVEDAVQYEGDLYVLNTAMHDAEIETAYVAMLYMLKRCEEKGVSVLCTSELPSKYLLATDYISNKCYELGLVVSDTYPKDFEMRKLARDLNGVWK